MFADAASYSIPNGDGVIEMEMIDGCAQREKGRPRRDTRERSSHGGKRKGGEELRFRKIGN